jgi:hypothetical protein
MTCRLLRKYSELFICSVITTKKIVWIKKSDKGWALVGFIMTLINNQIVMYGWKMASYANIFQNVIDLTGKIVI